MDKDKTDSGKKPSRKRPRSSDSNQLPISKRMGDLTLRPCASSTMPANDSFQNQAHRSNAGPSNQSAFPYNQQVQQPSVPTSQESLFAYEPEISAHQNPHYYYSNKILFEAHMENIHYRAHKDNA